MNETQANINGLFTIESQTRGARIAWILGIPFGLAILAVSLYPIYTGKGFGALGLEKREYIYIFMYFFAGILIPAGLVLLGLIKIFMKPGVYLKGIRTTDTGFESGTLTVDLSSVEPKDTWTETFSGRILAGNWEPLEVIASDSLEIIVFLKEHHKDAKQFFFERFVIASKDDSVLYQLKNGMCISEISKNDMVTMLNGSFHLLGDRSGVEHQAILKPLEQIADVISTSVPDSPPSCTLTLVAKAVDVDALGIISGAFIATGVSAVVDSLRERKLEKKLNKGKLFDEDFMKKLTNFLIRRGWAFTTGGKVY